MGEAEGGGRSYRKWIKMLTTQRAAPQRLVNTEPRAKWTRQPWTEMCVNGL